MIELINPGPDAPCAQEVPKRKNRLAGPSSSSASSPAHDLAVSCSKLNTCSASSTVLHSQTQRLLETAQPLKCALAKSNADNNCYQHHAHLIWIFMRQGESLLPGHMVCPANVLQLLMHGVHVINSLPHGPPVAPFAAACRAREDQINKAISDFHHVIDGLPRGPPVVSNALHAEHKRTKSDVGEYYPNFVILWQLLVLSIHAVNGLPYGTLTGSLSSVNKLHKSTQKIQPHSVHSMHMEARI
eukprot:1141482-Pelagomonas_calceolata.AAC.3